MERQFFFLETFNHRDELIKSKGVFLDLHSFSTKRILKLYCSLSSIRSILYPGSVKGFPKDSAILNHDSNCIFFVAMIAINQAKRDASK